MYLPYHSFLLVSTDYRSNARFIDHSIPEQLCLKAVPVVVIVMFERS